MSQDSIITAAFDILAALAILLFMVWRCFHVRSVARKRLQTEIDFDSPHRGTVDAAFTDAGGNSELAFRFYVKKRLAEYRAQESLGVRNCAVFIIKSIIYTGVAVNVLGILFSL